MQYLQSYDRHFQRVGILRDAYDVVRTRRISADYTLTFNVPVSSDDFREKLPLKGHVKDERGQYYVINSRQRTRDDRKLTAQITCTHVMFKLADYKFPYASYIDEAYGIPISQLTALISAATAGRFTITVADTFDLVDVKDFGGGNCLEALNDVLDMYDAEVEPDNFTLTLRKKIGDAASDFRVQIKRNLLSASFTDSGTSLCTRLFAEMKDSRTWIGQPASILTAEEQARLLAATPGAIVNGLLTVNYLVSQYASLWASDSVPYYDDTLTEQDVTDPLKLLDAARLRMAEREVPALEVSVSAADLYKLDKNEALPGLGDTVMLVDVELGLERITARITEMTEYPFDPSKHTALTVANVMRRDYAQIIADLEAGRRAVESVFSGGKVRAEAFEAFAAAVVKEVDASKTEVKYDARGIVLQDRANALRQVVMSAAGIYLTTDGGVTARTGITADGIAAEQVIGQFGSFVSMAIGSGNNIVKINTNGISAGHADFNSAPFRLDMSGNLIANKLTANSASIASSTFTGGEIVGTSINVGSGVFTVNSAGHMRATSGEFTGAISASSITGTGITASTISGGTITGALIQTSSDGSYPYAAMSSASRVFTVAASANSRVEMTASGGPSASVGMNIISGGSASSISYGNSGLYLYGNSNITMEAMGVYLRGYNGTYVSRWSDFKSEETGSSFQSELNALAINLTFDTTSRNLKLWSKGGSLLAQVNIPA